MSYTREDEEADWRQQEDDLRRMGEEAQAAREAAPMPVNTECPACHKRPLSESYVWIKRNGLYHKEYRCMSCIDAAVDMATSNAIKYGTQIGNTYEYHGPDIMGSDGKLYREQRLK